MTHLPIDHDELAAPGRNHIPEGLPGGFFVYDADDERILFADKNVIELFGCRDIADLRAFAHDSFKGMVHPDDYGKVENDIKAQTARGDHEHDYVRYRIVTKQGETRYVEDFGHLLHGEDGSRYFYVFILDVDRDEYFNRRGMSAAEAHVLSSMQGTDRITGLMNRTAFYEDVQPELDKPPHERAHLTFVCFDIANFRMFNEGHGFERGDDLLRQVAGLLRENFPEDRIARLSDDLFMVCTDVTDIAARIERVHEAALALSDEERIEVKAGLYELEAGCTEAGTACDHAKLACDTVKRRFDRFFGAYDVKVYEMLRLQQYVVQSIDNAIRKQYLKVFYQPVIRVETGKICGYEALARWVDPEMGYLPPTKFIKTLEEYRLIHKVDTFVIRKVCEDMNALAEAGEPVVPVSVNLSRLDFELCDIVGTIERYRNLYDIAPAMIDVEITESALNTDASALRDDIGLLRAAGHHIWIDDFGSGYSSLNNLLDYDFDVLKLDMEFMHTYNEHPQAAALIRNIVQGSRALGVEPLQEGVETEDHFEFLKSIGCERAQGYLFAAPMGLDESRRATRAKGLEWE